MFIPNKVEQKIRFTCSKKWNVEWSGVLFYTYEGSFKKNNLVIKCVDFYLMDVGNSTYTEFDMSPDVISYMTENQELLDCKMGLIHSHNNMSTFFSGTDQQTLKEEGADRNNFVSLIVNNSGEYTAAITRRVHRSSIKERIKYEFFDEDIQSEEEEYEQEIDDIEWFNLNIEVDRTNITFPEIERRLKEIEARKEKEVKNKIKFEPSLFDSASKSYNTSHYGIHDYDSSLFKSFESESKKPSYLELKDATSSYDPYDYEVKFDEKLTDVLVMQLLTGRIFCTDTSKFDLNKWLSNMVSIYTKRFGTGEEGDKCFECWAESIVDFLVYNTTDTKLKKEGYIDDCISSMCAESIIDKLETLPKNKYISKFINILSSYTDY